MLAAGVVDEDSTHGFGGDGDEVFFVIEASSFEIAAQT